MARNQTLIDQLLERYVSWRDEKTASISLNKDVSGFSDVIKKVVEAVKVHLHCLNRLEREKTHRSLIYLIRLKP